MDPSKEDNFTEQRAIEADKNVRIDYMYGYDVHVNDKTAATVHRKGYLINMNRDEKIMGLAMVSGLKCHFIGMKMFDSEDFHNILHTFIYNVKIIQKKMSLNVLPRHTTV